MLPFCGEEQGEAEEQRSWILLFENLRRVLESTFLGNQVGKQGGTVTYFFDAGSPTQTLESLEML